MNEERMNRLREIRTIAVLQAELVIYADTFSSPTRVDVLTDRLSVGDPEINPINQAICKFFETLHAEGCDIEDVAPAKLVLATQLVELYQHEAKRLARELAEEAVTLSYVTNDGEGIKV